MSMLSAQYMPFPVGVAILSFIIIYTSSLARWHARSHGRPLPPGPKTLPFIGSPSYMFQPNELWKAYKQLIQTYGDIVYLPVLGQSIMLLGSQDVLLDLLDKRSALTADRPQTLLYYLTGQDVNFAFKPYDSSWRSLRKAFVRHFTAEVAAEHLAHQYESSRSFLRKLLQDPRGFREHIRYTFAASIVKVLYGLEVADSNDEIVSDLVKGMEGLSALVPGRYLVQFLPFAKLLPTWIPFFGSQVTELAQYRKATHGVKDKVLAKTRAAMERGEVLAHQSVLGRLIADDNGNALGPEELEMAQSVTTTAFIGAIDTTWSTLQSFFLAMSISPEAQNKAQAELDAVVGPDRLPTHNDRKFLPYTNAVMKEVLRWQNAAPNGVAHCTLEDMEYRGYFIPKGTILIPQTWACLHDPTVFPNPDTFLPDRFLRDDEENNDIPDPRDLTFGYGRRICAGKDYAEASLFINMTMVLHVFNITPPLDEQGREIAIEPKMTGSFLAYPADCRCTIKPRSAQAESLIVGAST